jgi:hypothetical protein
MGMMPPGGQQQGQGQAQGQQKGQGGQQPPPPASVPPEALMALLSFLMQKGGDTKPGEPAPAGATESSQGSLTQILPMIMKMLSSNPQQAQGQQAVQQGQQQAQQPPEILKMLSQLGLGIK